MSLLRILLLSVIFIATSTLVHSTVYALSIDVGRAWVCEIDDSGASSILQSKKSGLVSSTFKKAKRRTKRALRKAKRALRAARRAGKKKAVISRRRGAVQRRRSELQEVRACESGTLQSDDDSENVQPGEDDDLIGAVEVSSTLSVLLPPDDNYSGNSRGKLDFTDVTPIAAGGAQPSNRLKEAARAACYADWDFNAQLGRGGASATSRPRAAVRAFMIRAGETFQVSLNPIPPGEFWFSEPAGNFTTVIGRPDIGSTVQLVAGYWLSTNFNQRLIFNAIEFEFDGRTLAADCKVGPELSFIYPQQE